MSTRTYTSDSHEFSPPPLPRLEPGDHLDQKTFHARYEAMPEGTRAELVGGVVYMPSPMKNPHGQLQRFISGWLFAYEERTPGADGSDGPTVILNTDSEPQPDACLYIRPDKNGQVEISDDGYLTGAPELVVEIASSTESYDLHSKKRDCERAGVREYIVVVIRKKTVYWFVRRDDGFVELQADEDGILRSEVFPGLWLDADALLRMDRTRIREVLKQGCATEAHQAFVQTLSG